MKLETLYTDKVHPDPNQTDRFLRGETHRNRYEASMGHVIELDAPSQGWVTITGKGPYTVVIPSEAVAYGIAPLPEVVAPAPPKKGKAK